MNIKNINIGKSDHLEYNVWEEVVYRICNSKYVNIEFAADFEPEFKLKYLYDHFRESNSSLARDFGKLIYSLLNKIRSSQENFDIINSIILFLELTHLPDEAGIIKKLVNSKKFINLTSPNGLNLHMSLLNLCMLMAVDIEGVKFAGNYIDHEVNQGKLFDYPSFFNVSLRYFARFYPELYFHYFEKYLARADSDKKIARLIYSIAEFERENRSLENVYSWLSKSFAGPGEFHQNKRNFITDLYKWADRKFEVQKDPRLSLILALLRFYGTGLRYEEIDGYIRGFIRAISDRGFVSSNIVNDFSDLMFNHVARKYRVEPLEEEVGNVLIICPGSVTLESTLQESENEYFFLELDEKLANVLAYSTDTNVNEMNRVVASSKFNLPLNSITA